MALEHLLIVDTETTHLDRRIRRPWETGVIHATIDQEAATLTITEKHQLFLGRAYCDLDNADPFSLSIGRFHERHPEGHNQRMDSSALYRDCTVLTEKQLATVVHELGRDPEGGRREWWGDVPDFDEQTLEAILHRHYRQPTWGYHLNCFEVYARGWLAARGVYVGTKHKDILAALEQKTMRLVAATSEHHTGLGDCMGIVRGLAATRGLSIVDETLVPA